MNDKDTLLTTAQKNFIQYLKDQKKAHSTILAYGKDIAQLVEFLGKRQVAHVTAVTPEMIEEFKEYLADNKYVLKSISRKLNSTKTFFKYFQERGLILRDPAAPISHPRYVIAPPRILTKIEYRALRDVARNDIRTAAIIEILLQTGMTIGELGRLELNDIKNDQVKIKPFETHPERTVYLNEAARKALDAYLNIRPKAKSKVVFVTKNGQPLLVRNIRAIIDRYFQIADIKNATVNSLRHTFIAHQLMAGVSVVTVQKMVGHQRLATTEKYLKYIQNQLSDTPKLEEL